MFSAIFANKTAYIQIHPCELCTFLQGYGDKLANTVMGLYNNK
jgi:hypothetical protein